MRCECNQTGSDATRKHSGQTYKISGAGCGSFTCCENHLERYLLSSTYKFLLHKAENKSLPEEIKTKLTRKYKREIAQLKMQLEKLTK